VRTGATSPLGRELERAVPIVALADAAAAVRAAAASTASGTESLRSEFGDHGNDETALTGMIERIVSAACR